MIFTFQKTGAANLGISWTFFRKAVGNDHSPHGTYDHLVEGDLLDLLRELLAPHLIGRPQPSPW